MDNTIKATDQATRIASRLAPTPRSKDILLNVACGNRLRKWRKDRGWTMQKTSDEITDRGYHMNQDTYRNYERGTIPPVRVLIIFNSLGIDLNWYICGK